MLRFLFEIIRVTVLIGWVTIVLFVIIPFYALYISIKYMVTKRFD